MPEGVTPTTSVINLLHYGETQSEQMLPDGIIARTLPGRFLDEITLVDTPGTNAIVREHEALTQRFVPRSDLVLFITSADRPFTESEREFMADIREWGKKITVIINKIDLLRTEEDRQNVIDFVTENIERLLGFRPEVFPVSALLAQQAKSLGRPTPPSASASGRRAASARSKHYIFETLDEEGRIRLKLLSPLGIAEHLPSAITTRPANGSAILADDVDTCRTSTGSFSSTRRTCAASSPTT